jgi:predicted nucleic acid-binding protein
MAFLEREPGFEKVESYFLSAVEKESPLLMSSVNWGEVYYIVLREYGPEKADEIEKTIESLPIEIVPVDLSLAKAAGSFKATHKMSYADCFAAALTKVNKGELVTGDKEFKTVEGEVRVAWIS